MRVQIRLHAAGSANVGALLAQAGRFDEARTAFQQLIDRARDLGQGLMATIGERSVTEIELYEHNYKAAQVGCASIRKNGETGDYNFKTATLQGTGLAALDPGDVQDASSAFNHAAQLRGALAHLVRSAHIDKFAPRFRKPVAAVQRTPSVIGERPA